MPGPVRPLVPCGPGRARPVRTVEEQGGGSRAGSERSGEHRGNSAGTARHGARWGANRRDHGDVRILVTNDDGLDAPGLHALAAALAVTGHDLVVAAPTDDRSGSGAAVGPLPSFERIPVRRGLIPSAPDVAAYGVEAPPAMIVLAAGLGAFGAPPDLVLAGINPGANTGRAVLHSGTVGATLTAGQLGRPAIAVSIDLGEPQLWDTAAWVALTTLDEMVAGPIADDDGTLVLSINVPNLPRAEVAGLRWAELAAGGSAHAALVDTGDDLELRFDSRGHEAVPGTDVHLVGAGFATVTRLLGIRAGAPPVHLDGGLADRLARSLDAPARPATVAAYEAALGKLS